MELVLFGLLAVLLIFMFFNTRKRQKQMKAEQEEKAQKTVPGAKVLLQGGLYGTIVAYDADDLDSPALVEIAPGTVIEVHSQAILRVVEPTGAVGAATDLGSEPHESVIEENAPEVGLETPEETRARLDRDSDNK
jgi:preprotein translocase subunit YajC